MGWTHHWQRPSELPAEPFAAAVSDCATLMRRLPVELAGFDGTGSPIFEPEHIVFNGCRPQHGEPFEITRIEFDRQGRAVAMAFCKTSRLPYDLAVMATLVILRHHLGSRFQVGSDGTSDDWAPAVEAVERELGYGHEFQLVAVDG